MIKITEKNFDQYKDKLPQLIEENLPKNAKEFSDFCKNIFGFKVPNSFVCVGSNRNGSPYVTYEIKKPDADTIEENKTYQLWSNHYRKLEEEANKRRCTLRDRNPFQILINKTFGELRTGGIASCYYGSTECDGLSEKQVKNLMNWDEDKTNTEKLMQKKQEQSENLKAIFGYDPFD